MSRREKDEAALRFIEEVTSRCDEVQRAVLAQILSRNAETEYLKRHGMNGCVDMETFKNKIPVVTYEDIHSDIQRIANGDFSPLLCAQPITEFLTRYMPGLDKGKGLYFQFIRAERQTPGGLMAHPVITSYYKSKHFKNRPYDPYYVFTSPDEAVLCTDSFQSMYTQMLCGLYDRHVVIRMGAVFASGLLRVIRFLQLHYADLCHDITTGTLNSKITDSGLRACMGKIMRPDPKLAEFVNLACEGENWEGIIKRIWPNTKYLEVIVTGVMAQYIPTLDYFSGGLPKVCTMYASSECFIGLNLNPMCAPSEVSYTILPNMAFFEFIPLGDTSATRLVNLADVKVGKEYELVVTTHSGLYRYRVGDVLYVTGFYNSTPQFKFIRRKNVLLSIDSDKTDELELQNAIQSASELLKPFNTSIVHYTSVADAESIPGHYVIYWELLTKDPINGPGHEVLGQCSLAIEEALNSVYRECRVTDQSIGPLEIRIVKNGTFEELMDYAISRGASINQYKVPSCVNGKPIVELLDSCVVSVHFSPSLPHWSPQLGSV
ncbi:hypothetical protein SOVF_170310 [Spinacia oleracea]|nr:hypothetical protein SOVF_170310 [Spinacia oleracea]